MARRATVSRQQVFAACDMLAAEELPVTRAQVMPRTGGGTERIKRLVDEWHMQKSPHDNGAPVPKALSREDKVLRVLECIAYQTSQSHLVFADYLEMIYARC